MQRLAMIVAVLALCGPTFAQTTVPLDAPAEPVDLTVPLREALDAFVVEEIEGITPEIQGVMVDCILPVFDGIENEMITRVLAEPNFERGLGIVLTAYPEREEIIEACEELL